MSMRRLAAECGCTGVSSFRLCMQQGLQQLALSQVRSSYAAMIVRSHDQCMLNQGQIAADKACHHSSRLALLLKYLMQSAGSNDMSYLPRRHCEQHLHSPSQYPGSPPW